MSLKPAHAPTCLQLLLLFLGRIDTERPSDWVGCVAGSLSTRRKGEKGCLTNGWDELADLRQVSSRTPRGGWVGAPLCPEPGATTLCNPPASPPPWPSHSLAQPPPTADPVPAGARHGPACARRDLLGAGRAARRDGGAVRAGRPGHRRRTRGWAGRRDVVRRKVGGCGRRGWGQGLGWGRVEKSCLGLVLGKLGCWMLSANRHRQQRMRLASHTCSP